MAMTQTFFDSLVGMKLDKVKTAVEAEGIEYDVSPIGWGQAAEIVPTPNKIRIWIQPSGYVDHIEAWDPSEVTP